MPPSTNHLPSPPFLKKDSAKNTPPHPLLVLCELPTTLPDTPSHLGPSRVSSYYLFLWTMCEPCPDPTHAVPASSGLSVLCVPCHRLLHQLKKQEASFWSRYCGGTTGILVWVRRDTHCGDTRH